MQQEKEEWNLTLSMRWQNTHQERQQRPNLQHRKTGNTNWHIHWPLETIHGLHRLLTCPLNTWQGMLESINAYAWVKSDHGRLCDVISMDSIWEEIVSPCSKRSGAPELHLFRMTEKQQHVLSPTLFLSLPSLCIIMSIPPIIMSSMHSNPNLFKQLVLQGVIRVWLPSMALLAIDWRCWNYVIMGTKASFTIDGC